MKFLKLAMLPALLVVLAAWVLLSGSGAGEHPDTSGESIAVRYSKADIRSDHGFIPASIEKVVRSDDVLEVTYEVEHCDKTAGVTLTYLRSGDTQITSVEGMSSVTGPTFCARLRSERGVVKVPVLANVSKFEFVGLPQGNAAPNSGRDPSGSKVTEATASSMFTESRIGGAGSFTCRTWESIRPRPQIPMRFDFVCASPAEAATCREPRCGWAVSFQDGAISEVADLSDPAMSPP